MWATKHYDIVPVEQTQRGRFSRHRHRAGRFVAIGFLWIVLAGMARDAAAQAPCAACEPRRQDEVWLVSTRHLGCPLHHARPAYEVQRYDWDTGWHATPMDSFLAACETPCVTVFYVTGYDMNWDWTVRRGCEAYQALASGATTPIRFVIWSWPSEHDRLTLGDVREKGHRTDWESVYLSQVLVRMPEKSPTTLIGYSYGGRIVTGALHLADGGTLGEFGLNAASRGHRFRVVLMAPALHNHWLLANQYHSRAANQAAHMLVLYNTLDPVLVHYRLVDPYCKPMALGYVGVSPAPEHPAFEQCDVARHVGLRHHEHGYLHSPAVMHTLRQAALWQTTSRR